MWIAFHVGQLMMNPVCRYPCDRTAFQRQRSASRQKIFHPFRSLEAAMRKQPVIAHPDPETSGYPPQHERKRERLPRKEKQRGNRANVKRPQKKRRRPVDRLFKFLVIYQYAHGWNFSSRLTSASTAYKHKISTRHSPPL